MTATASRRMSFRSRCSGTRPARSRPPWTSRRSARWVSGVRRCHRSVRSPDCASHRVRPARRAAPSCGSTVARCSRRPPRRSRKALWWKCATFSSTCRHDANSCAPNPPNSDISPGLSSASRWHASMWRSACATVGGCSSMRRSPRHRCCSGHASPPSWGRPSWTVRCRSTGRPAGSRCEVGSVSRRRRVRRATSSSPMSTAARCAIDCSPTRSGWATATCSTTDDSRPICCISTSSPSGWMSMPTLKSSNCGSVTVGRCTISCSVPCTMRSAWAPGWRHRPLRPRRSA